MRTGGLEGRNYSVPSSVLYTPHPTVGACDSLHSIRTDNTIFGHGIAGRLPLVGGTEGRAAIGWPARIKHSRTKIGRNGREMLSGERDRERETVHGSGRGEAKPVTPAFGGDKNFSHT